MNLSARQIILAAVASMVFVVSVRLAHRPSAAPRVAATRPATLPTSLPTTFPQVESTPQTYLDVVCAAIPNFPTTQSLGVPLELSDSARIVFPNPVHLNPPPRAEVWLTHPDAPPFAELWKSKDIERQQTFVVREQVLYAHWLNPPTPDDPPQPIVVVRQPDGHVVFMKSSGDIVDPGVPIEGVDWSRAEWFNNELVAPGAGVVRVFSFAENVKQTSLKLGPASSKVWTCVDAAGGLLAWSTGESGSVGRFVDGTWTMLDPQAGWSPRVAQLVPLLDGSVLQIALGPPGDEDSVELKLIPLVTGGANLDEKRLAALVEQLSDLSQVRRDAATDELSRYGPDAWPVLEKLIVDQPPEVMMRMKRVMGDRLQPTLAGMKLVDGKMKLVTRLSDGGCVFYATSGVSIARHDGDEDIIAPAWIAVRPGRAITRLPDALVTDLRPDHASLDAVGNEWIVNDNALGPKRLLGNRLVPLLRPAERAAGFDRVVGIDRRGRWLFKRHANASGTGPTLVIDPTLPDPTPRLPVWTFAEAKEVGWTDDGWPAVRKGRTWTLREEGWQLVDEKSGHRFRTELAKVPAQISLPATTPTTQPLSVEDRLGPPILTTADGTRFFDGYSKLAVVTSDGKETSWPLPADVVGRPPFPVALVSAPDKLLFLFNQPGRVIRLKSTPQGPEPFQVDATFTKEIPSSEHPSRIWLDPAGRIVMTCDNKLTVLFPAGRIPPGIRNLMTGNEDDLSP